MEFWKLQGSGNDFVVIDDRDEKLESFLKERGVSKEDFVRKVCAFHTGVGADGLILIKNPDNPENDFKWEFFNSDGSVAEMCGNGSRCAVRFAYERGIVGNKVRFETLAGVIKAEVYENGRKVKVQLTPPSKPEEKTLTVDGEEVIGVFINTGVPHFVVPVEDVEKVNVIKLGRAIRFHEEFQPKGTNVNFVQPVSEDTIKVRTYERGVESETLACGTGATACAIVSYLKGLVKKKPVNVLTRSGEVLTIDFSEDLKEVFLTGSVYKVFEGRLSEEVLEY
ncbi:diaminopimelate epimerase [Aquifex aeolicus]|uniref:Diaminopimelate epimerase n=1 Tax=Aquifex aeolicus (strain VF5) TaxID=224324 RepID=DAPF_AQUAE|nr:diaminopimelate epimerase [Aquifex aeolicus]O67693.1 RecName: Full=Diaminopimelate epimerase; Short=DAP epimerase; AltName: Full=PLP-independent amino acid racemase [Aquifex aeolicus VF5]AAC07649.1 diaminopimelate epimerase [Aquifex aeolicus VF5]